MKKWLVTLAVLSGFSMTTAASEKVEFRAAGSLKAAMTDVITQYQQQYGVNVASQFAPSGLLRQRIEQGEKVDLYASANMKHPQTLNKDTIAGPVVRFAGNKLCAITQANVSVTSEQLLQRMLAKDIRVGTSTPKADPAGDYAWKLFAKAEKVQPGSEKLLQQKALQLTGGEHSAKAPEGRNPYGWVMENNQADIFLTYCTNAVLAQKEVPALRIVSVPEELSVGAQYGLTLINGATPESAGLAHFILSSEGQEILAQYGFDTPLK
ncbi:molybdate ABC transporter substrate-binding protein [Shewanella sp. TC10]|uniref:molybdate ABC transporter substrate-binding protein n=1 Tax=Shewanella sp. TC10 TaxID=1419739 RepID=UPI00129EDFE3|nr:molybdate ABC transporter substrate-binding protein [Shewanella sp. TC10]